MPNSHGGACSCPICVPGKPMSMPDVPVDERSERRFTVADFWSGLHDLLHPVEPLSDRRWEVLMAIVEERISRRARRFLEAERDEVRRLRTALEADTGGRDDVEA